MPVRAQMLGAAQRRLRVGLVRGVVVALLAAVGLVVAAQPVIAAAADSLDAGGFQTCAVFSGKVSCWGNNEAGQLGDGTTTSRPNMLAVGGALAGVTVTQVSVGWGHTCALTSAGSVYCWGWNFYRQLADGSTTNRSTPVAIGLPASAIQISAGGFHTCALLSTGAVYCWGYNAYGQLGDNSTTTPAGPVAVVGLPAGVTQLSAGENHTCALLSSGALYCWGANFYGRLGDGSTTDRHTPVAVSGLPVGVSQVGAGRDHTCAVLSSGAVYCWGDNGSAQLGDGSPTGAGYGTPRLVGLPGGATATQVSSGFGHSCALSTSAVYCWGDNHQAQLGDGTSGGWKGPVAVVGLPAGVTMSQLSTGDAHNCAVSSAGAAYCWGWNQDGELGDGSSGTGLFRTSAVVVRVPPQAPTGVTATKGDRQATVSWTAPSDVGSGTLTGYAVTASPGGVTCTTTGATTCTVTGLSGGTPYTFTVVAQTGHGTSIPSGASASVTPDASPTAPRNVTATPADTQVTVSWTAPSDLGTGTFTGYTATASPGAATCTTTGATTCTVTGLTNGTPYTFTVTARNSIGDSPASTASAAVKPRRLPGAPTAVTAMAGSEQASVSWTAPSDMGSGTFTNYIATASPGNRSCTVTTTGCVITGLTRNTAYTFTVVAHSSAGDSLPSTASASVTPYAVPTAPTGVTATPDDGQATVSWTAPSDPGTGTPDGYTVTANPDGETCTANSGTSCIVTGLDNGTEYTFRVVAHSSVGDSPISAASAGVTPFALPGAPTGVTATPGDGQATVSWTAPASPGTGTLTGYLVTADPGAAPCTTTGATTCTVTGLTNGTAYTFTVVARTGYGDSPASVASGEVKPYRLPGAPTGVTVTKGDRQAVVSWTAPSELGSGAFTGYTAIANPGGNTCTTTSSSATSCTITGLTGGTTYTFTVVAVTADGASAAGAPPAPVTPYALPGAPTGVTATAENGQIRVSWTAPSDLGTGTLTGYTATASPGGATCTTTGATTCVITGLANGTSYTITVVAHSSVGDSPAPAGGSSPANASAPVIPAVPGAPHLPEQAPAGDGPLTSSTGAAFTTTSRTATLTGAGFAANTPITIGIYSTPQTLTTALTDSTGVFSAEVTVPAGYTGAHTLVAVGLLPDQVTLRTLTLHITIADNSTTGLAHTGTAVARTVGLALALLVVGAVAVVAVRRRRPARTVE